MAKRKLRMPLFFLFTFHLLISASIFPADKIVDLQARFDHEPKATSKLKILEKLGEAQFAAINGDDSKGDYGAIGLIFEKYRDNVRVVLELLKQQEPNADKHAEGYRHLELQARRGIREVDDVLVIVPDEVRPPLQIVREDLIHMDGELINILFPPRTKVPAKVSPVTTPHSGANL